MNGERELTILKNIVRVGSVSSVNTTTKTARVAFADKQDPQGKPLVSGPLKVVQAQAWLPIVGQFVLCLFLPNGESDGFVIGGI